MPNENDTKGGWLRQALSPNRLSPDEMYNISKRNAAAIKQDEGITGVSAIDNFLGGIGSNFLGGIGDAATFVGANNVGNFFNSGRDWIEERLKPAMPAEFSLDYLTSPEGLLRGTGNTLGSMASILAPTALIPGGVFTTIGRGISAIPKIGKLFSPTTANMTGRWFASGIPEAAMEGGNWYRNSVANGMDPDEAWDKRWGVFGRNAAFLPVSNALQWGLFSKMLGGRPILSGLGELGSQALEEGGQEGFSNELSGKPYTYNPLAMMFDPKYAEQAQAMKEGFMGFLLPTLGGIGIGTLRNRAKRNDEQPTDTTPQDETTPTTQEYLGEGGKGEGTYWQRQNTNVSIDGAQPETLNLLDAMGKWIYDRTGKPATTSAVTNGDHAGGEHSHAAGWKIDLHDGGFGAEGSLFTDDFQKGKLADEFMKYWQARGVGVNLEGLGTGNVHFDISTAGYQWKDNDGNDLAEPFYRSGFNSKGGTPGSVKWIV